MTSDPVVGTVIAIVGLLLVAAVAAIGLRRARLPYSVGLVLIGLLLGSVAERSVGFGFLRTIDLSPEIILFVFLPTLIFESAFNLDSRLLSKNLIPVLALAAPGLLLSTALTGFALAWLTPLTLGPALLFGALISATDPVAVVALFREIGAPRRLAILVEGESLFNDATAIVLFHIILAGLTGAGLTIAAVGSGVGSFLVVFLGGLVVGVAIGYAMVRSISLTEDDPLVQVALSTVVAYAAFIAAEHYLHVSGVMATVGAGTTIGVYGIPRFTSSVRDFLHQFWEYAAFVANGLIFLLVGLSVSVDGLVHDAGPIGWAVVTAVGVRALTVFGLVPAVGRLPGAEPIDGRYRTVLWWGGLRGAVGLALAFSLPDSFPARDLIIAMAVGVVLFTLLSGGLTMRPLLRRLGLDQPTLVERMARAQADAAAKQEALGRLDRMAEAGHFSARLIDEVRQRYGQAVSGVRAEIEAIRSECAGPEVEQALWLEALAVEKASYRELQDQGFISETVLRELELAIDIRRDEVKRGRMAMSRTRAVPLEVRIASTLYRGLGRVAPRSRLMQRHRLRTLAARYESDTALFEAGRRVVEDIGHLAELSHAPPGAVEAVTRAYEERSGRIIKQIDDVAEHFPEYVAAVQRQTALRIALDGEADAVERLARSGGIPGVVVREARRRVERAQRRLLRQPVQGWQPGPDDLLVRVPFFHDLAPQDFQQVVARLAARTVLDGETIIRQGDRGSSLFLIARGVVGVFVERGSAPARRIASLHAGDFFGEMALLSDTPRTATVRAMTGCQLYELSRRDVDALCEVCEGARDALIAAAAARRAERQDDVSLADARRRSR